MLATAFAAAAAFDLHPLPGDPGRRRRQFGMHRRQHRHLARAHRQQAQVARLPVQRDPAFAQALAAALQVQQGGAVVERAPAAQVVAAFHPVACLQRFAWPLPVQHQRAHRLAQAAGIDQPLSIDQACAAGRSGGRLDPDDAAVLIALGHQAQVAAAGGRIQGRQWKPGQALLARCPRQRLRRRHHRRRLRLALGAEHLQIGQRRVHGGAIDLIVQFHPVGTVLLLALDDRPLPCVLLALAGQHQPGQQGQRQPPHRSCDGPVPACIDPGHHSSCETATARGGAGAR